MANYLRNTIAVLMVGTALTAFAQGQSLVAQNMEAVKASHKIINIDRGDTIADNDTERELIDIFFRDQFRHYQDSRAPYFLMLSKNNKMAMGIGGTLSMQGWFDAGGTLDGAGFTPYDIAVPKSATSPTDFGTSFTGTKLFFSLFGKSNRFGKYQVYIAAKFNGAGIGAFKLNKAYATVGDWTLGYANSTFTDPSAQPNTVDPEGPNAEISDTNILLRYTHEFKGGFVVAGSVETPDSDIPTTAHTQGCSDFMPNFAAFAQYQWGDGQHVRLSGLVRGMRYRDLVTASNHIRTGWGAHLSTVLRPAAPVTFYGAFQVGKGISSMVNDLENGAPDLLPTAGAPGQMYAPLSYGWYAALQYNFRPNIYSSVIFGQERFSPDNLSTMTPDTYKYGLYATANVFWEITPRWQVAAEYNWGQRHNIDGSHASVNRVSLLASFSF